MPKIRTSKGGERGMETRCTVPLYKVKEVIETTDINKLNELIEKNWILLMAVPRKDETLFSLGRID